MVLDVIAMWILSIFLYGTSNLIVKSLKARNTSGLVIYSMSYLSCMYMMMCVASKILE